MARLFAAEGARLTLLARDEGELARAAEDLRRRGAHALTLPCDVRDRAQVEGAVERVLRHYGRIDVLVNNAGVIQVGPLENMRVEDFENAMAVHFWGPLYTMLAAVPAMKRQGGGRIVNIASIGGKVAVPHLAPYSASKFALVGLSDGVRAELAKDGIAVTTVCPWLTRTGSHLNAQFKGQHERELGWFAAGASLPLLSMDASLAARRILEACRHGDAHLVLAPQGRAAALANELFPESTARLMKTVSRLLPAPDPVGGDEIRTGWESTSRLVPSLMTRLSDRAAERNNEVPPSRNKL